MKPQRKATHDDDEARYRFTEPLHIVFAQLIQEKPPVVNGRQLSVLDQKGLAVVLFECVLQTAPSYVVGAVEKSLRERWPDCNWDH